MDYVPYLKLVIEYYLLKNSRLFLKENREIVFIYYIRIPVIIKYKKNPNAVHSTFLLLSGKKQINLIDIEPKNSPGRKK